MCQINAERGYSRPSDCSELRWWLDSLQKTMDGTMEHQTGGVLLQKEGTEVAKYLLYLGYIWDFFQD